LQNGGLNSVSNLEPTSRIGGRFKEVESVPKPPVTGSRFTADSTSTMKSQFSYQPQTAPAKAYSDSDSESELDDSSSDEEEKKVKKVEPSISSVLDNIKTVTDLVPTTPRAQPVLPPRQSSLNAKIESDIQETKVVPPPQLVKQKSSDSIATRPHKVLDNFVTVEQLLTRPQLSEVKPSVLNDITPAKPRSPPTHNTPRQSSVGAPSISQSSSTAAVDFADMTKSQIEQLIDRKVAEKMAAKVETQLPPRREFYKPPEAEKSKKNEKSICGYL
jgi:hypothetical protein